MNSTFISFYVFSLILLIGVVTAFVVAVASLIATIVRWKSPNRGRHVRSLSVLLAAIPLLIAIQQAVQWLVFVPAISRQHVAERNARRAENLGETSIAILGEIAPQFSTTTADGEAFSLPNDGKVVLVNFFATWCGPCLLELPHIEQIWKANKSNKNFRLIVIGREESTEAVRDFREKHSFSFPIAADLDRSVYSLFATELIPRTLVVSPDGRIVYSKAGFSEDDLDELNEVLRQQFAGIK